MSVPEWHDLDREPEDDRDDRRTPPYQKTGRLAPSWQVGSRGATVMSRNAAMRLRLIKPTAEFPFDPFPEERE